jgi:hypothetical protein
MTPLEHFLFTCLPGDFAIMPYNPRRALELLRLRTRFEFRSIGSRHMFIKRIQTPTTPTTP